MSERVARRAGHEVNSLVLVEIFEVLFQSMASNPTDCRIAMLDETMTCGRSTQSPTDLYPTPSCH